ncbi:glucose 1-dehydrogenase-like protein [Leptotrombidium deliense]|uniref:Glucose 1-dehydrogenase-like protein n=1 Tax=Leptotrombidium deliense TaxID=299467 RepID=A0A443S3R2_9ACAR|nr:glucose 1-dehydrogenase-like protein [Leptotrombidium deliense]
MNIDKVDFEICVKVFINAHSFVHVGDLTVDNVSEDLVEKAAKHFGTIDVLVNNAGMATMINVLDENFLKHYDYLMNTNTRVPLKLSRLVLPYLLQSKG